jgi:hypothetical protein
VFSISTPDARLSSVLVRGTGLAAHCCLKLLGDAGIAVRQEAVTRPARPALLMSEPALALVRDCLGRPELLADHPRVRRRIVAWGGKDPVAVDHDAIVLTAGALETALSSPDVIPAKAGISGGYERPAHARDPSLRWGDEVGGGGFTLHIDPPFPIPAAQSFGHRPARALPVRLRHPEDREACWIEAVEQGWLFLLPSADDTGWLLCVGESTLDQSHHIAPRIEPAGPASGAFETAPRLLENLTGNDWLACGPGAIAFDPICGDGSAQAVREAILAVAVVTGIAEAHDAAPLLAHYQAMLLAAMRRHLRLCGDFYATGGQGPWWRTQFDALRQGFDWCTARLAAFPEPAFELHGFRLERRLLNPTHPRSS